MRDTRKDEIYFNKYLEFQYNRIEKKTEKLKESDNIKKQKILLSLVGYELDLIKAEFSLGASKEKIKVLLNRATKIAIEYKNITYEDLLNLLSLAIIVNDTEEAIKLVKSNNSKVKNDRLLNCLSIYIDKKEVRWDKNLQLLPEYSDLNLVFISENKEYELLKYLNEWYSKHAEYGWYNSHLGDLDTYCGYWSFESAAISIILDLNKEYLKKSVYFPVV